MRRTLVALVALAMITASCGDGGSEGIKETRPVTVTGEALPRLPEAGVDVAVGMPMPELAGASFDGTPVSITNDGRPKIILFLAHW